MNATQALAISDVTMAPKMRPAKTEEGVTTGMWVTLAPSVALLDGGNPIALPAGTLLSGPHCGGFHSRLNSDYEGRSLGIDGKDISYRM